MGAATSFPLVWDYPHATPARLTAFWAKVLLTFGIVFRKTVIAFSASLVPCKATRLVVSGVLHMVFPVYINSKRADRSRTVTPPLVREYYHQSPARFGYGCL